MLSKSQISLLKSLQNKKERDVQGLFLVEGYKSITEFLNSPYQMVAIYHTASFDPKVLKLSQKINLYNISDTELEKISSFKTPQNVIALIKTATWPPPGSAELQGGFSLVLDEIQDPGNMGTIIRTADWFGIKYIICSENTVDRYNPKVVQGSMGSLARVSVTYTDITTWLPQITLPIFGAMLNGENIYHINFGTEGLILLGNEGNGLHRELEELISKAITIPRIGKAESLNVAIAAALFCFQASRKKR